MLRVYPAAGPLVSATTHHIDELHQVFALNVTPGSVEEATQCVLFSEHEASLSALMAAEPLMRSLLHTAPVQQQHVSYLVFLREQ